MGKSVAQICLLLFNIIFMLSGVAVLGMGIWLRVNRDMADIQKVVDWNSQSLFTAAYILMGFGAFVFLASALGFAAAVSSKKGYATIYIILLVTVIVGEGLGVMLIAIYTNEISGSLKNSLTEYNKGSSIITKAWDYIQVGFNCCGWNGPRDYNETLYIRMKDNNTLHVPTTCCELTNSDPEKPVARNATICQAEAVDIIHNKTAVFEKTYLKLDGCYDNFMKQIKSHLAVIIGSGVGIGLLQLLGIAMACSVCMKHNKNRIAATD